MSALNLIAELKAAHKAGAKLVRKIWDAELGVGSLEAVRAAHNAYYAHAVNLGVARPQTLVNWDGETGPHELPTAYGIPDDLKSKAPEEILARLRHEADRACQLACDHADHRQFRHEAINWDGLHCFDARISFDDLANVTFSVA